MRNKKIENYKPDLPWHRHKVRENTRAGDFHYNTEAPFVPPSKPIARFPNRDDLPELGKESWKDIRNPNPEWERRDDLVSAEEKTRDFFDALRQSPNFRDLDDGQIFGLLRDSFKYDNPGASDEDFKMFFMEAVDSIIRGHAIRDKARRLAKGEQKI